MRIYLSSFGLLFLRVSIGVMMVVGHGIAKIQDFDTYKGKFLDFMGLGMQNSLILAIVGEVVCCGLIVLGLGTRFAALGLAITMGVAAFVAHGSDPWFMADSETGRAKEMALLYLIPAATLIFTGPGAISLDYIFFGRKPKDANLVG